MNHGEKASRPSVKQRALAATGLAATAAAGLGVAAAEAQAASGKVHACYNKSTHALKYSKKASCAKGSKLVTWNKQGPQGAPGAKGAQGPQGAPGATPGYADTKFRFPTSGPPVPVDSHSPVASFTPASAGYFAVNAIADVTHSGAGSVTIGCFVEGGASSSHTTNYTALGFAAASSGITNVATTGIVYASPGKPAYERCGEFGTGGSIFSAAVTGQRLTAAHLSTAGKHVSLRSASARKAWAAAAHRFEKKAK